MRNLTGYISYFKMGWILYTLNMYTVKLRKDEVEYLLYQFVFIKISEFKKDQEEKARNQFEVQLNQEDQENMANKEYLKE